MNNELTPKSFIKNSIFFIVLIGITFFILYKDNNLNDIIVEFKNSDKIYVLIGIICTFIYVICETINFRTILKFFSYKKRFLSILKYPFIGFFFSSITPSASGGQPMQIYYMSKDNIEVSHGSLAIFIEFASFQFVTILLAVFSFIFNFELVKTFNPLIITLIIGGIIFNFLILLFILCVIFSKKFTEKIANFIFWIVKKIRFIKIDSLKEKFYEQVEEYQRGAVFIRQHKEIMIKVIFTTFIQVCALYSITFWVYRALGFSKASFVEIMSLQAVLYVAVSGIPLPGAVGASESSFLRIFKTIYPTSVLSSAMLLSRGISFYLFVLISGVVVMYSQVILNNRKNISG